MYDEKIAYGFTSCQESTHFRAKQSEYTVQYMK